LSFIDTPTFLVLLLYPLPEIISFIIQGVLNDLKAVPDLQPAGFL
jgi:hypothetical protein